MKMTVQDALSFMGLEAENVTTNALRAAYRRLSKRMHPDRGGSAEDFRRLSHCKEVLETWLRTRRVL